MKLNTYSKPLRNFIGREKEISFIESFVDIFNVFLIQGETGIGKTSLCLELIKKFSLNNVIWIDCYFGMTEEDIFSEFISFFPEEDFSENKGKITTRLIKFLEERNVSVFLDDFHYIEDDLKKHIISNFLNEFRLSRLFINYKISFDIKSDDILEVCRLNLEGFDKTNTFDYFEFLLKANSIKVSDIDKDKIYDKTRGIPLILKQFSIDFLKSGKNLKEYMNKDDFGNYIKTQLVEEFLKSISKKNLEFLEYVALSRKSYCKDVFESILDIQNMDILEKFDMKFLLFVDSFNNIIIHSDFRDYIISKMSSDLKKKRLKKIGLYLLEKENMKERVEALFYLIRANCFNESVDLLMSIYKKSISNFIEFPQLKNYILKIFSENIDYRLDEFLKISVKALLYSGTDIDSVRNIIDRCEDSKKKLLYKAYAEKYSMNFDKAIYFYEEFIKDGIEAENYNVLFSLAFCYVAICHLNKAKEILDQSEKIFIEVSNKKNRDFYCSVGFLMRANVDFIHADYQSGFDFINKSIKFSKKADNRSNIIPQRFLKAKILFKMNNIKNALSEVSYIKKILSGNENEIYNFDRISVLTRFFIFNGNFDKAKSLNMKAFFNFDNDNNFLKGITYFNSSMINFFEKDLLSSLENVRISLDLIGKDMRSFEYYEMSLWKALVLVFLGEHSKAFRIVKNIENIIFLNNIKFLAVLLEFIKSKVTKQRFILSSLSVYDSMDVFGKLEVEKFIELIEGVQEFEVKFKRKNVFIDFVESGLSFEKIDEIKEKPLNYNIVADVEKQQLFVDGKDKSYKINNRFGVIIWHILNSEGFEVSPEELFERVWPGEKFNSSRLRVTMTKLKNQVGEFLEYFKSSKTYGLKKDIKTFIVMP